MKNQIIFAGIAFFCLSIFCLYTAPCSLHAQDKMALDFSLTASSDSQESAYLGVKPGQSFTLGQIDADTVIIEVFSMYCPVCQREAPNVNQMFSKLSGSPALDARVKLIGIGAGNSTYEVNFFKEKYKIKFPLFSDTDFSIHKKIGEVRTPYFIGLNLKKDGAFQVFYTHAGDIGDPKKFLDTIISASGRTFK